MLSIIGVTVMNEQTPATDRRRLNRGILLKWTAKTGWLDRDGVQPVEGPYLLWGLEEGLQRWQDQAIVEEIVDKPLPDIDKLNAAIPKSEWEEGLDGNPKPPWSHQYVFYLLDPNGGQIYTYMNSTTGAKILWQNLEERWTIMRELRGDVWPVVNLSSHQFKTRKWDVVYRADLKVIEWRKKSGPGPAGLLTGSPSPQPQLPPVSDAAPAPAKTTPPPFEPAQSLQAPQPTQPQPTQPSTPPPPPPPPRPAAKTSTEKDGLAFLDKVERPTVSEELNDSIPSW